MIVHQKNGQLKDKQYRVNLCHNPYILLIQFDKDLSNKSNAIIIKSINVLISNVK